MPNVSTSLKFDCFLFEQRHMNYYNSQYRDRLVELTHSGISLIVIMKSVCLSVSVCVYLINAVLTSVHLELFAVCRRLFFCGY